MRYLIALLLLVLPLRMTAAQGDVTGAEIGTDGMSVYVYIEGLATNGTFASGLGTNNTVTGNEKAVLKFDSQGYNYDATLNTNSYYPIATHWMRNPYPNQNYKDVTTNDTTHIIRMRLSLSRFVAAADTNMTLTVGAGFYTDANAVANNAGTVGVTNSSIQPYNKVVGNWNWPGSNLETGSVMVLRAVGFHASARGFMPLACVTFTVTDESANTYTTNISYMEVDYSMGDALPHGEYIARIPLAGFDNGEKLTCNFIMFPHQGDTNAVLDTSKTGYSWPTPYPAPLTNVCDRLQTYGRTRAIVDPNVADDTTGIAASEAYWAGNQSPAPFKTTAGALAKIAATNNAAYGRNNIGGGIVYWTNANHTYLGAALTLSGTDQDVWCDIVPLSGTAVCSGYQTDGYGKENKDKIRFTGISYEVSAQVHFRSHIWHHRCNLLATGAAFIGGSSGDNIWYLTQCNISNITQGIRSLAANLTAPALVRGNTMTEFNTALQVYTVTGNLHPAGDNGRKMTVVFDIGSQVWLVPYGGILYNNAFYGLESPSTTIFNGPYNYTYDNRGAAIIQNIFEQTTNSTPSYGICGNDAQHFTNVLVWNNSFLGARNFMAYNQTGTAVAYRWLFSMKNNVFEDYNTKHDTFTTENANRIGGWPILFGVDCVGNVSLDTAGSGAPESFDPENAFQLGFGGLGWYGYYLKNSNVASSTNWPTFIDRKAYDGAAKMPGNGDYRINSRSPLLRLFKTANVLPFDIHGRPRGIYDAPGTDRQAEPRSAAMTGN